MQHGGRKQLSELAVLASSALWCSTRTPAALFGSTQHPPASPVHPPTDTPEQRAVVEGGKCKLRWRERKRAAAGSWQLGGGGTPPEPPADPYRALLVAKGFWLRKAPFATKSCARPAHGPAPSPACCLACTMTMPPMRIACRRSAWGTSGSITFSLQVQQGGQRVLPVGAGCCRPLHTTSLDDQSSCWRFGAGAPEAEPPSTAPRTADRRGSAQRPPRPPHLAARAVAPTRPRSPARTTPRSH